MSRRDIYYWKCDRPAAFHGTQERGAESAGVGTQLEQALRRYFGALQVQLSSGVGQGNHLTWNAEVDGVAMFVRVENGPERDGQLAVESGVMDQVRALGVRTPLVHGVDATRSEVPFAWQALERIGCQDLNHWFKQGCLKVPEVAHEIGVAVATWQGLTPPRFGPFDAERWGESGGLAGYHGGYADYFCLRLEEHLDFLVKRGFLSAAERSEIAEEVANHAALLEIKQGCLVHKDLALWNVLGEPDRIAAFIDFDDAISGDAMDDLSLLGCFHDTAFLESALAGYQTVRALPDQWRRRFWLHLLRNMIVKAVIRVGAGYFDRGDGFFLIGTGGSGADLRRLTQERLALALHGLRSDADGWLRESIASSPSRVDSESATPASRTCGLAGV